jgi:probable F420-dependent oxidoreductase
MDLGRVGIWTFNLDMWAAPEAREAVREIEELGYAAVWLPETVTREAVANSSLLLSATDSLVVATGIASIWARPAQTAAAAHKTISEAYPGRFVFGLGVSHQPMVEGMLKQSYDKPYSTMAAYLEAMAGAFVAMPDPAEPPVKVIGALGPRMLRLAAEQADGAHPYNATPEHTAQAREILGPDALLCPEQAVVLDTDPETARAAARRHLAVYLGLPNYFQNWFRLGFTEADLADGGSDRLIDAIVIWGDEDAVAAGLRAHLDAGADHVCAQIVMPHMSDDPRPVWRTLAPALTSL